MNNVEDIDQSYSHPRGKGVGYLLINFCEYWLRALPEEGGRVFPALPASMRTGIVGSRSQRRHSGKEIQMRALEVGHC